MINNKPLNDDQKRVLAAMNEQPDNEWHWQILYEASEKRYYRNSSKHFGVFMNRLMKRGSVIRVKPGFWKLKVKTGQSEPVQFGLFKDTGE